MWFKWPLVKPNRSAWILLRSLYERNEEYYDAIYYRIYNEDGWVEELQVTKMSMNDNVQFEWQYIDVMDPNFEPFI